MTSKGLQTLSRVLVSEPLPSAASAASGLFLVNRPFITENKGFHTLSDVLVPESLPSDAGASGPLLANRPFLAGSDRPSCPKHLPHLSEEDVNCYRLQEKVSSKDEVPSAIANLVHSQLDNKGALLVRGLSTILPTNAEFGRLASLLGPRLVNLSFSGICLPPNVIL